MYFQTDLLRLDIMEFCVVAISRQSFSNAWYLPTAYPWLPISENTLSAVVSVDLMLLFLFFAIIPLRFRRSFEIKYLSETTQFGEGESLSFYEVLLIFLRRLLKYFWVLLSTKRFWPNRKDWISIRTDCPSADGSVQQKIHDGQDSVLKNYFPLSHWFLSMAFFCV